MFYMIKEEPVDTFILSKYYGNASQYSVCREKSYLEENHCSLGMPFKMTEEVSFISKQNVLTCSSFLPASVLGLIWLGCDCHSCKIIPVNWESRSLLFPTAKVSPLQAAGYVRALRRCSDVQSGENHVSRSNGASRKVIGEPGTGLGSRFSSH